MWKAGIGLGEANACARRSRRVSGKNHNELVFLPLGTVHSTVSLFSRRLLPATGCVIFLRHKYHMIICVLQLVTGEFQPPVVREIKNNNIKNVQTPDKGQE